MWIIQLLHRWKLAGEQRSQEHVFRSIWKDDWFEVGAALSWMLHPKQLLGEAESCSPSTHLQPHL